MDKTLTRAKTFLQLVALAHILGGILLPLLVDTPLFTYYNDLLYQALGVGSEAQLAANFLTGLFGPTIASWGVLFLYVVTTAFETPDKRGWWAILVSCIVWAPYDSLLSIQHGIYLNAAINLMATLAILIPTFMARKHFFHN